MRKKPATSRVRRHSGGARRAAFSAVATSADIKSASRRSTLAFGEQPSGPLQLQAPEYLLLFHFTAVVPQSLMAN